MSVALSAAFAMSGPGPSYVFFDCDDCCYQVCISVPGRTSHVLSRVRPSPCCPLSPAHPLPLPLPPLKYFELLLNMPLPQNDWRTAAKITTAIASYTEKLGVSKEQSYALYKKHGTCLTGMLAEGILQESQVEDYLFKVHDIDYSDIDPDPALAAMILRMNVPRDRRIVFTASTKEHASRCLAKVLAPKTVDDYFSSIVDSRTCRLETKHSASSFVAAMDAAGVPPDIRSSAPSSCVLLDDSVTNIRCAKNMGWTTVLVGKIERDTRAALPTPPEADYHIASLHELEHVMPHLFDNT